MIFAIYRKVMQAPFLLWSETQICYKYSIFLKLP